MQWPRRGVLIRALIYGPIIAFLAWQAYQSRCGEPEPEPKPQLEETIETKKQMVEFPDGTKHEVHYVTPDEFKRVYGKEAPAPELAAPSGAPAPKTPD